MFLPGFCLLLSALSTKPRAPISLSLADRVRFINVEQRDGRLAAPRFNCGQYVVAGLSIQKAKKRHRSREFTDGDKNCLAILGCTCCACMPASILSRHTNRWLWR